MKLQDFQAYSDKVNYVLTVLGFEPATFVLHFLHTDLIVQLLAYYRFESYYSNAGFQHARYEIGIPN
jgi:hypothetical protein